MKDFTLFWLDGSFEIVKGQSISSAFSAYYLAGAIKALDFWVEGDDRSNWKWDKTERSWRPC